MWRILKRRLQSVIAPAIFLSLVAYFTWSATQGERGLASAAQRQHLLAVAQGQLAQNEAERDAWERRVAGLRTSHLDRDTLDERARAMLNLSDPADIVVQYAPKDRVF